MQVEQKSTASKQSTTPQPRTLDSFGFVKRTEASGTPAVKRAHEVIALDDDEPPLKRAKTSHVTSQVPANNSNSFRSISGKFSNQQ